MTDLENDTIALLRALAKDQLDPDLRDPEAAHADADRLLIEFLQASGYAELAAAWLDIRPKRYC